MPVVNPLARELVFKIVYYGPGLGGKTTTLQYIHATTKAEHRGKMVSLATPVDRTLYFDFLPIRLPNVRGMGVRLQLFTVPGQVYYNATRKLVLTGADGIVLVADSQRVRADSNLESLENLNDNLREHGRALADVPHVIAYNKRDLSELITIAELEPKLNRHGAPSFGTVATRGDGVYESLEAITRLVLEDFERRIPQGREPGRQTLELPEGGLAAALRSADAAGVDLSVRESASPVASSPSGMFRLSHAPESAPPGETAARAITELGVAAAAPSAPPSSSPAPSSPEITLEHRSDIPESDRQLLSEPLPPAAPARVGRARVVTVPAGSAVEVQQALQQALSFASLWTAQERDTVHELESALGRGEGARAIGLADQLVSRTLAGAASVLGSGPEAPRDPATVVLLLGVDGRAYLEFRNLVREARSGREPSALEALRAYVFALQVRLARSR